MRRVQEAEDNGPRISNEDDIFVAVHACDDDDEDRTRAETICLILVIRPKSICFVLG